MVCASRLELVKTWFWSVSFQLTGRESYGYTTSLDAAKAASGTK